MIKRLMAITLAWFLCSCMQMGDRVAGTSTEAGNAGGKIGRDPQLRRGFKGADDALVE